jgi:autotransporter-associated beta strand protein
MDFNGGTLQSYNGGGIGAASSAYTIPTNLNVQAGGAVIDSNAHTYWIQTPLLHDAALGSTPDGGLTVTDSKATGSQTSSSVTLQGANTYTGATVVQSGGDLVLAGAATAANSVVLAAATIADSSAVTVNSGGVLTLANNAAATQVNALNISGGTLTFELNSSQTPSLSIGSAANVSGVNNINIYALAGTSSFTYGTYNLITDSSGGLSGGTFQFTGGGQTAIAGPLSGGKTYLLTLGSSDTAETLTISAVPEPTALGLFAMGGMALVLLGRKRKAQI